MNCCGKILYESVSWAVQLVKRFGSFSHNAQKTFACVFPAKMLLTFKDTVFLAITANKQIETYKLNLVIITKLRFQLNNSVYAF